MITAIIPIFELDSFRRRNLEFIYDRLCSAENLKIILAVQTKELDGYFKKFERASVKKFFDPKYDYFSKGFIFNSCIKEGLATKFVMLLDADVYLPFKNLDVSDSDEVVKPFSECVYLNEDKTMEFIHNRKVELNSGMKRISALGGGAFIMNSEIVAKKGVFFDEDFQGWGYEDIDFGETIRSKSLKIRTIDQTAVHLYHPPSDFNPKNETLYRSKEKLKSKLAHVISFSPESASVNFVSHKEKRDGVLLINASEDNYLNDDNFNFSRIESECGCFDLRKIVESALPYVGDDGWILYTDSNFEIGEYVYPDILRQEGDFFELFGCSTEEDEGFVSGISGFAVRKSVWLSHEVPKLFINRPYWPQAISAVFGGTRKKTIRNQLFGPKLDHDLENLDQCGISNLEAYQKILGISKWRNKYDISVITPTGGRPYALALCEKYIRRSGQGMNVQWIVVNDLDNARCESATHMIFRRRDANDPNPLGRSIKEAVRLVESDFILFMEDDDWYSSDYIPRYHAMLQKYDMVGQGAAKFYNVRNRTFEIRGNSDSASLCQTGIRTKVLLENLRCFDDEFSPWHDMLLWQSVRNRKLLEKESNLCVGIKGMPGRPGLGDGHKFLPFKDESLEILGRWVGEDLTHYRGFFSQGDASKSVEKFCDSKKVLYLSPFAPDFDMSSGGGRLLRILEIIRRDLGCEVCFLCHDSLDPRHIVVLERMGIRCFESSPENLEEEIARLSGEGFGCAFFSWHEMASRHMNTVRRTFPGIKVVVDSVDFHWKRASRGVSQGLLQMHEDELSNLKRNECQVYLDSDVVFACTEEDKADIRREIGDINIKTLSNIHEFAPSALGNDIVFIGNFFHEPNISAALDCIEIYKDFKLSEVWGKTRPKLVIAGSHVTEDIISAAEQVEGCVVLGWVGELDALYSRAMVSMSPLKWGSGIKGKVCEAASRSVLVLTSDIGNEGVGLKDAESGFIANSNKEFCKKLELIYGMGRDAIARVASEGRKQVCRTVSKEAALSVITATIFAKPVVISIVTHNRSEDLRRCLLSILENTCYPNYRIVVVDNASDDETRLILKKIQEENKGKIDVIRNEINEYFITPNNKVIEMFPESDVVLVNDDLEITSRCWLSRLYSAAYSRSDICAAGGKILFPNGMISEAGSELYNDGSGTNLGRWSGHDDPRFNHMRTVGYCSGCLLYMRRDAIEKVGLLDSDFFPMYYEDSEWQYRAHLKGLKTIYEPLCVAVHHDDEDSLKPMKLHQKSNKTKFLAKYSGHDIEKYNS